MRGFLLFLIIILQMMGRIIGETELMERAKCGQIFKGKKEGILYFSTEEQLNGTSTSTVNCSWTIEMEAHHKVAVTIRELTMNINDSLVITEYFSARSDAELSNRKFYVLKPGSVIFSQSNKLKVKMIAMINQVSRFSAVFEDAECGGVISEEKGEIKVPMFVHFSNTYRQCQWKLIAPVNKIIKLSFSQFYLAPGSCIFEGLTVKDGDEILGDYCEENPPAGSLISSRNSMSVSFTKRPGFEETSHLSEAAKVSMNYEFVNPCESTVKARFGTVSVPHMYAGAPPPQEHCQWDITVPEGNHISLIFMKYTTGPNIPGQHQEIQIYDGINNNVDSANKQTITLDTNKNRGSLIWSTNTSLLPPFKLVTASNNLRIVRTTKKTPLYSKGISFKVFFQAEQNIDMSPDDCINIGNKRFFQCSNGHYIDCNWRCDGIVDCADGIDEAVCIASDFEVVHEDSENIASNSIALILAVALTGSAFAIFSLVTLVQRRADKRCQSHVAIADLKHDSHYRYYVDLKQGDLPSYREVIDAEVMFAIAKSKARRNFDNNMRQNTKRSDGTVV